MSARGRAVLLACVAVTVLSLAVTGRYGDFVQQRMRIPLVLAGLVVAALAVAAAIDARRGVVEVGDTGVDDPHGHDGHEGHEGHSHDRDPRVAWLLVLPVIVLVAVGPSQLQSAAAPRVRSYTPPAPAVRSSFAALKSAKEPASLGLREFINRAWDPGRTLGDHEVRLVGFVAPGTSGDGFLLTRFVMTCCAADAVPVQVAVHGVTAPPTDTWVQAVVRWRPPRAGSAEEQAELTEADVVDLETITAPPNPYEIP